MTTDKQLLEAAARAAGYELHAASDDGTEIDYICLDPNYSWMPMSEWNPLTDDGDALRLAVKLRIDLKHYADYVVGWFDGGYIGTGRIQYGNDAQAATRLCITRAAAACDPHQPEGKPGAVSGSHCEGHGGSVSENDDSVPRRRHDG